MLARALIVVLTALNLGVAAWWLVRPAPPPYRAPASDAGGAELQLLPRADRPAPPANAAAVAGAAAADAPPDAAAAAPTPEPAAGEACLRAGPFAARDAARAAQARLAPLARVRVVEEPGPATGYRVLLPPAADRAAAEATAARIAAAGFDDLVVLTKGEDAHAIALGTYRNRATAERRVETLRAAGFPAELRTQGRAGASRWWLELAGAQEPDAVRAAIGDAQVAACTAAASGAALESAAAPL